ncbi:hypothetical protein ABTX81_14840 [Kitasatospora sp. NPDC097605]|uniref:hypothetical protein n=1 Tax=Kitasatospora sp. NPDC097605 TaxID=3157226 RepID=UPI00332E5C61
MLAPIVGQWLERGSTAAELAHALLPGLPAPPHSPVAILRDPGLAPGPAARAALRGQRGLATAPGC